MEKGGLKVGGEKPFSNIYGVLRRDKKVFRPLPEGWGLREWEKTEKEIKKPVAS